MTDIVRPEKHKEPLPDAVIRHQGMQLTQLLGGVAQHPGSTKDVMPHLGVELHDLLRSIVAAPDEIVEAEAEECVPELCLKPSSRDEGLQA